jgi:hypothetical protein
MLYMLGTQTVDLEPHNVRGPYSSTSNTGHIVPHADLGSKEKCTINIASSSSAVSLELSECTDILWKSEPSSLSDTFCALSFLVFLTLALFLEQSSCFLAVVLVCLALLLVTKFFF